MSNKIVEINIPVSIKGNVGKFRDFHEALTKLLPEYTFFISGNPEKELTIIGHNNTHFDTVPTLLNTIKTIFYADCSIDMLPEIFQNEIKRKVTEALEPILGKINDVKLDYGMKTIFTAIFGSEAF